MQEYVQYMQLTVYSFGKQKHFSHFPPPPQTRLEMDCSIRDTH